MWRNDDLYVALWASAHPHRPEPPDPWAAARDGKRAATLLPAAPLMHGTGLFAALAALAGAGTVVLVDRPGLDAERDLGHRRRANAWRCSRSSATCSLVRCSTSSTPHPTVGISPRCARSPRPACCSAPRSSAGCSRTCRRSPSSTPSAPRRGWARATRRAPTTPTSRPAGSRVNDRIRVVNEETGRDVAPGTEEVGLVAMGGRIPVGYFKDPEKSAATFRVFDGCATRFPATTRPSTPTGR